MVCDNPSINSGKHYKVILIDSTSGKDVVINKEIVYRGYANWNPLEKNILDTLDTSNLKQDLTQENEVAALNFIIKCFIKNFSTIFHFYHTYIKFFLPFFHSICCRTFNHIETYGCFPHYIQKMLYVTYALLQYI